MNAVAGLRRLGHKRITLKTGSYGMEALALAMRCAAGLQQFMAGARKVRISDVLRDDLMAANRETAAETGIPYMTDAENDKPLAILLS